MRVIVSILELEVLNKFLQPVLEGWEAICWWGRVIGQKLEKLVLGEVMREIDRGGWQTRVVSEVEVWSRSSHVVDSDFAKEKTEVEKC